MTEMPIQTEPVAPLQIRLLVAYGGRDRGTVCAFPSGVAQTLIDRRWAEVIPGAITKPVKSLKTK